MKTLELRQSVLADPDKLTQLLENTRVVNVDLQHTSLRKMTNFTQFIVTIMNNKPLTLNLSYCQLSRADVKQLLQLARTTRSLVGVFIDQLGMRDSQELNRELIKNYDYAQAE